MGYIVEGKERFETPNHGVVFRYANPCDGEGGHEYSGNICPNCGRDFCYSCWGSTNVHEGGKYDPDFMDCPHCGHDYYAE